MVKQVIQQEIVVITVPEAVVVTTEDPVPVDMLERVEDLPLSLVQMGSKP